MTTEMKQAVIVYCEQEGIPCEETLIAAEYIDQHFNVLPEALPTIAADAQWTIQHNVDSYGCDYDWAYGPDGLDFILHDQFTIPDWAKKEHEPSPELIDAVKEYVEQNIAPIRDNLLVTFGTRAAYMDCAGEIRLPVFSAGEDEIAAFAVETVDRYLARPIDDDTSYDEFIETALMERYGKEA